jgi:hypothetical protein
MTSATRRPTLFVTGFPYDTRAKELAQEFEKSVFPSLSLTHSPISSPVFVILGLEKSFAVTCLLLPPARAPGMPTPLFAY